MRSITVASPEGRGDAVAKVAFSVEIDKISRRQLESYQSDGKVERKDVIDIETSTPKGKRFLDELLAADFYNREDFTISVRQPRSILSKTGWHELTKPFVEPAGDVLEELWQYSQLTASFVVRIFIASCLLADGMIEQKILLLIAGLLFLPLTPLLLAVSFGARAKIWKLTGQGALAFLIATILLFLGGAAIAAISEPPIKYSDFNTLLVSFLISVAVGIAAAFANIDEVGQRQLIGLAATAQIALIPVWFGICAVFGFPTTDSRSDILSRAASFFLNSFTIIVSGFFVYLVSNAASVSLQRLETEKTSERPEQVARKQMENLSWRNRSRGLFK
jgi:hypothetical protein